MGKKDGPVETGNSLNLADFIDRFLSGVDLSFKPHSRPVAYEISIETSTSLNAKALNECFELIADTSQHHYEPSSMGWHPKQKRKEMRLPDLRYLLVRETLDSPLIAFASFMLTYEDGMEVVYVYEIHMAREVRGSGLGRLLMDIVSEVGKRAGMEKVMLTVFESNQGARSFYERLGYTLDDFSPEPRMLRNGTVKHLDYSILSKRVA